MKHAIKTVIILLTVFVSVNAFAIDPVYTGFFSNQAIKGYDTVAYFKQNKPVMGSEKYSTKYQGANWLFSSQENLDLFNGNPEKYAPQYGGYCAYAVSQNQTASIKPELFTIHDGRLYLNYNKSINEKWLKAKVDFIDAANKYWPGLLAS